jgi:L-fuculose-phosphate aldolase
MNSTHQPAEPALRQALVNAARELLGARLNCGTAGNVSARWADGLLISPSGLHPSRTEAPDIVCLTAQGQPQGARAPSSEWQFHRDIYLQHPQAAAIVHMHSPFATALACQRRAIPAFHYTVARFGGEDIRCADYAMFGTAELSHSILAALTDRSACLMANHGAVVIGADVADAVNAALELEWLCELYWRALQSGPPVLIEPAQMAAVCQRYQHYCRRSQ